MHKRKEGQPHKGWKASARRRFLDSSSLVAVEVAPGKPGLCECAACAPSAPATTDADLLAYLDTLPHAQRAYAGTMVRATFGVPSERAAAAVKEWLRRGVASS